MEQDQITIQNLVPRFLAFYRLASAAPPERRWSLWQERYGFAAVPPGEEGARLAQTLLERAWDRYPQAIPALEAWAPDADAASRYLAEVKAALDCRQPLSVTLLFFVGGFEGNAFAAPTQDGGAAICLPVEAGLDTVTLVHELTHLVHAAVSGRSLQWGQSVAELLLAEGLATRLSQAILPDQADAACLNGRPGWLEACRSRRTDILRGVLPELTRRSPEALRRFTLGTGPAGLEREGYYAGWELVGHLLAEGRSFADIARLPAEDAAPALRRLLA